jgi:hypothetical protein
MMQLAGPGGAPEAAEFAIKIGPVTRAVSSGSVKHPSAERSVLKLSSLRCEFSCRSLGSPRTFNSRESSAE